MMDTVEKTERQDTLDDILNDEIDTEVEQEKGEQDFLVSQDMYQISSGEVLNSEDFYNIAAKESTKLLLFLGPVASGKTTMETSLYQLFQINPVGNYYFAGSATLQGFEQRAFYTRIKSKGSFPETQRTSIDDNASFLHLRLWDQSNDMINNLILADISGEAFTTYIGKVDSVKEKFYFAERADFIIGIIDGEKLSNKKTKKSVVNEIILLLRTFLDAGVISDHCVLQIVFSKFDLLRKTDNYEEVIEKAKNQINTQLSQLATDIEYFCVAAMPDTTEEIQVGYGLDELLQSWWKKYVYINSAREIEPFDNLSEYDRLFYKYNGVKNE